MPVSPLAVFNDFRGGLNTTASPFRIGANQARALSGFDFRQEGRLAYPGAHSVLFTTAANMPTIARYSNGSVQRLLYQMSGNLYARNEATTATSNLGAPSGTTTALWSVFQQGGLAFVASGGAFSFWDGVATTLMVAGEPASTSGVYAPLPASGGAGNLDYTVSGYPYVWAYTNVSNLGAESNLFPTSSESYYQNEQANVTINAPGVGDPNTAKQTAKIRLYRKGGYTSEFRLVKEVAVAYVGINPVGPIVVNDNVRDVDQPLVFAPTQNYPPPVGFDVATYHKGRIYAASSFGATACLSAAHLWFSGLFSPQVWGVLDDTGGLEKNGGYRELDGSSEDAIYTLVSLGSALIIGRRRSIYGLLGNDARSFALVQLSNVGVVSKRAMCRAYNRVFYLGADKAVYEVTDSGTRVVSEAIERTLRAISDANIAGAVMAFFDGDVYLSIPASGCFALNLTQNNGAWRQVSDIDAIDLKTLPSPTAATSELLISDRLLNRVRKAYGAATSVTMDYQSPSVRTGGEGVKFLQGQYLRIDGQGFVLGAGTAPYARVYYDGNFKQFPLIAGDTPLSTDLGMEVKGKELYVTLGGTYLGGEIHRITLSGSGESERLRSGV